MTGPRRLNSLTTQGASTSERRTTPTRKRKHAAEKYSSLPAIELPDHSEAEMAAMGTQERRDAVLGTYTPREIAYRDPRVLRLADRLGVNAGDAFYLRLAERKQLRHVGSHGVMWIRRLRLSEESGRLDRSTLDALDALIPEWRVATPKTLDSGDPWPYSTGGMGTQRVVAILSSGDQIPRGTLAKWRKRQVRLLAEGMLAPELIAIYDEVMPDWRSGGSNLAHSFASIRRLADKEATSPVWQAFDRRVDRLLLEADRLERDDPDGAKLRLVNQVLPPAWRVLSKRAIQEAWHVRHGMRPPGWPMSVQVAPGFVPALVDKKTLSWFTWMQSRVTSGDIAAEVADFVAEIERSGAPRLKGRPQPRLQVPEALFAIPTDLADVTAASMMLDTARRNAAAGRFDDESLRKLDLALPGWRWHGVGPALQLRRIAQGDPARRNDRLFKAFEARVEPGVRKFEDHIALVATAWLHGEIDPGLAEKLAEIDPDWAIYRGESKAIPGVLSDDERQRIAEIKDLTQKTSRTSEAWYCYQRAVFQAGRAPTRRIAELDAALPGWRDSSLSAWRRHGAPAPGERYLDLIRLGNLGDDRKKIASWYDSIRRNGTPGAAARVLDELVPAWRTESLGSVMATRQAELTGIRPLAGARSTNRQLDAVAPTWEELSAREFDAQRALKPQGGDAPVDSWRGALAELL